MQEQEYKIENIKPFELADIFDCGQCFGSYTGIFRKNVINVQKQKNTIIFKGICDGEIKEIVEDYFDLKRNYEEIKNKLSQIDENIKTSIEYGQGIRILNQDLWEMIILYISNTRRIKRCNSRRLQKTRNRF